MANNFRIDPSLIPLESRERSKAQKPGEAGEAFDSILRERVTGLKFSAHAEDRLRRRGIELSVNDLERLGNAVNKAAAKGANDSLVLLDDKAFVVSVKNRTVITAMSGNSVKEGVFTKIDSAVVS